MTSAVRNRLFARGRFVIAQAYRGGTSAATAAAASPSSRGARGGRAARWSYRRRSRAGRRFPVPGELDDGRPRCFPPAVHSMSGFLQRLGSRRLRGIPAALCALAIAMQVMLPALHGEHDTAFERSASADSPAFRAAADHGVADAHHHAASCPQCRLVSQLKTLSPLSTLATLPVVRTTWIARSTCEAARSQPARDSGAPRAPPFFA